MTQADSVLSTPPLNTPIDTTRRRFLAVSSVAAAVGAGSLAAAAMATERAITDDVAWLAAHPFRIKAGQQ